MTKIVGLGLSNYLILTVSLLSVARAGGEYGQRVRGVDEPLMSRSATRDMANLIANGIGALPNFCHRGAHAVLRSMIGMRLGGGGTPRA